MATECPVCGFVDVQRIQKGRDAELFDCPNCGQFDLLGVLVTDRLLPARGTLKAAVLSHAIRKMQRKNAQGEIQRPTLVLEDVERLVKDARLPSPFQQADNLVAWLGENLGGSGQPLNVTYDRFRAIMGALDARGVAFIVQQLLDKGLLDCEGLTSHHLRGLPAATLTLSMDGWERFEALKRGASDSRKAFMAMQYGDADVDAVFRDCFKPAVALTGFELVRLDERPQAGLIDDRLRVEIRAARFLVADLTHGNRGAYWEAGYAEGLSKPVIYTCKKSVFDKQEIHFDTNHRLTVLWETTKLADAAQRLKDTIRATLPADSKLED
jgi:hypothetical protein